MFSAYSHLFGSYNLCFEQATDSYGHVHRHVLKLLRKADILPPPPSRHKSRDSKRNSDHSGNRKPVHAILPEEDLDEIPVHGPDGK